jgi:hypothetical protein
MVLLIKELSDFDLNMFRATIGSGLEFSGHNMLYFGANAWKKMGKLILLRKRA